MKLPAKIEYAYKAVMELSLRYYGDTPVSLHLIAEAQKIPENFLVQLLLRLKNANIVNSTRGINGGYYLTRPPSQISFIDVVKAIDGGIIATPTLSKKTKQLDSDRVYLHVWGEINKEINQKLLDLTFDKLISQLKIEPLVYNI